MTDSEQKPDYSEALLELQQKFLDIKELVDNSPLNDLEQQIGSIFRDERSRLIAKTTSHANVNATMQTALKEAQEQARQLAEANHISRELAEKKTKELAIAVAEIKADREDVAKKQKEIERLNRSLGDQYKEIAILTKHLSGWFPGIRKWIRRIRGK